jgi:hypothetical protein
MLLTVDWDGGGDGVNWTDPINWNGNALPGSSDDVVIDVPGTISVTKSSATTTIRSLTCQEDLTISGGTLTVTTGASVINGSLTMTGGTLTASGATATFTANGATSLAGASLSAINGGDLLLPNATSYTAAGLTPTIETLGTGSTLDLSGVTSITGATGRVGISVHFGSTLDLSSLTTLTAMQVVMAVSGGTLDLSALATWNDATGSSGISLNSGSGTVVAPLLTSFVGVSLSSTFAH